MKGSLMGLKKIRNLKKRFKQLEEFERNIASMKQGLKN
jgi:hypothetical protein